MNSNRQSVFYGWWVVFAAAVGLFWGPPVTVFTFSVFLKPLMQDFHASRAAISLGYTLHALAAAASASVAGWLIDRYPTRRVILLATALFGVTLLCAKTLSTTLLQYYLFYAALGALGGGAGPIAYGSVVSRWFDRYRGLALGLMMLGIGSGAMVMPPLAQHLIAGFGWRAAYAILGSGVLLICMPAVGVILKDEPQDLGLRADGVSRDSSGSSEAAVVGLSANHAWRTRTFWLMLCAIFFASASVQGCLVHLAAMLTDRGATLQVAALGSSLMGAALLIGRVGTGYLLDRFFAPRLAAVFFGGAAAGIGLLLGQTATPLMLLGAFLAGLAMGAEVDIIAYLTGRYFGLCSFGKLYGSAFGAYVLAGALGPLAMGFGFDLTGSYRTPLAVLFTLTLIAALLMTRLGPYRYHAQPCENEPILPVQIEAGLS